MSWIVAFTRKGCEHLAKANLDNQGYDVYLPLAISPGKPNPEPFFPRYLFVDTAPLDGLWRPVRSTRGCLAVLLTGEAPSVVPDRVIDVLRRREEAGVIRLKAIAKAQTFVAGQPIRVYEGNFAGFDGVFERMSGAERVRVLLNLFGRVIPVEVGAQEVA